MGIQHSLRQKATLNTGKQITIIKQTHTGDHAETGAKDPNCLGLPSTMPLIGVSKPSDDPHLILQVAPAEAEQIQAVPTKPRPNDRSVTIIEAVILNH